MSLIIVDDDPVYSKTLSIYLKEKIPEIVDTILFTSALVAEKFIEKNKSIISVIIVDYRMPEVSGVDFIQKIQSNEDSYQILLLTGMIDQSLTLSIRRLNIFDILEKSEDFSKIMEIIKKAYIFSSHIRKRKEKYTQFNLRHLIKKQSSISSIDLIVGESQSIIKLKKDIKKIAQSSAPCLISGESGTGKELVAGAIYEESSRNKNKYTVINCAAIPSDLIESELFGYKKGSFTGANTDKIGILKSTDFGTIFLDEITEIPLAIQSKLLRFLQEGTIQIIGNNAEEKLDLRVISATNKDISLEISLNNFREDLYYRLNVVHLNIPSLRERKDDIKILFEYFINFFSDLENKQNIILDSEIFKFLTEYPWPGNVRELKNVSHRLVLFSEDNKITLNDLPVEILNYKLRNTTDTNFSEKNNLLSKSEYEKKSILDALILTGGNKEKVAQIMGISRASVYRKIKEYNIFQ
jgi:DNA-binding NtrC family response regulator